MKTRVANSRLKMAVLSSFVLVAAWFWTSVGIAARDSVATAAQPERKQSVLDKAAEQDLREKLFLHRLSMGTLPVEAGRS